MDYSWLEVIKKSLDSLDTLASRLKAASVGETISDSELKRIVAEIEESTSRVSRLLSSEKNLGVLSKYSITAYEAAILHAKIDDATRKSLLQGNRKTFNSIANRLSECTILWRERIIRPAEMETPVLKQVYGKQFQKNEPTPDCKVVLLLGAGASSPLQLPTMADFWQVIEANSRSNEEQYALSRLLDAAKDETTHLPPDLEKLLMMLDRYDAYFNILWEDPYFGLTDNMKYRSGLPYQPLFSWSREHPLEQFMRRCGQCSIGISWIRDMVIKIMDAYYTQQLNKAKVTGLYKPLFSLLNTRFKDNRITIFTTNYDTAIEQYCKYAGIDLIDGFQKTGPSLVWNPAEYYQRLDPSKKVVTLFKLHGSLTWRKIGNEIREFGMSARSMQGDMALIYPTETKEYPYEEPFKTAYKFLDRFLKNTEVAIVIGYSFRDRGIKYIIDEAQSVNPNLKFIIVCGKKPDSDIRKRFPHGSRIIGFKFKPGAKSMYLVQLNKLLNEILK